MKEELLNEIYKQGMELLILNLNDLPDQTIREIAVPAPAVGDLYFEETQEIFAKKLKEEGANIRYTSKVHQGIEEDPQYYISF